MKFLFPEGRLQGNYILDYIIKLEYLISGIPILRIKTFKIPKILNISIKHMRHLLLLI